MKKVLKDIHQVLDNNINRHYYISASPIKQTSGYQPISYQYHVYCLITPEKKAFYFEVMFNHSLKNIFEKEVDLNNPTFPGYKENELRLLKITQIATQRPQKLNDAINELENSWLKLNLTEIFPVLEKLKIEDEKKTLESVSSKIKTEKKKNLHKV
jgi:hypothetical protein